MEEIRRKAQSEKIHPACPVLQGLSIEDGAYPFSALERAMKVQEVIFKSELGFRKHQLL